MVQSGGVGGVGTLFWEETRELPGAQCSLSPFMVMTHEQRVLLGGVEGGMPGVQQHKSFLQAVKPRLWLLEKFATIYTNQ